MSLESELKTLENLGFYRECSWMGDELYFCSEKYNGDMMNEDQGIKILENTLTDYVFVGFGEIGGGSGPYVMKKVLDVEKNVDLTVVGNSDEIKFLNDLLNKSNVFEASELDFDDGHDSVTVLEISLMTNKETLEKVVFKDGENLGKYLGYQEGYVIWAYLDGSCIVEFYDSYMGFLDSLEF